MTASPFPIDLETIDTATRKGAFGLLIRHGAREPITTENNNMLGAQLTEEGRKQARKLGERLKGQRPHVFYASPVTRCVDTNLCILEGMGFPPDEAGKRAQPQRVLAEAFMEDTETAKGVFRLKEPEEVILDYLRGKEVPGFGPIEKGATQLLDFIKETIQPGTLSVFVTHDALVMPFRQHFLGDKYTRESWLPFLGGCVVYEEGGKTWVEGQEV